MFRKTLAIAGLQLRLTIRSKGTFIWMLLVPIIFTTVVALAFGETGGAQNVPVALTDLDHSAISSKFEQTLRTEKSLSIRLLTEAEARQDVHEGTVAAAIIVPADFGQRVQLGVRVAVELVRPADQGSGYFLEQLVRTAASHVSTLAYAASLSTEQLAKWQALDRKSRQTAWWSSFSSAESRSATNPGVTTSYTVLARTAPRNELPDNRTQSSTGYAAMFVMAGVLGAATALVSERLRATLSRILTTPTTTLSFLTGKLLALMLQGLLQLVLFILWGRLVLHVDWGRDPAAIAAIAVAYVFAATGIGILTGSLCRTLAQAGTIATFVTYTTSMLAGCWWPVEIMPPFMQRIAQVFPQYWAVNGFNKIIVRGLPLSSLTPNIIVLGITGIVCLAGGSIAFTRTSRS